MNSNLFLIIIIALILTFLIILYNGLRILLTVEKEKGIVKYELKATILKIPIFRREGTKGNGEDAELKADEESENSEEDEEFKEYEDEKGLIEKYKELKPILKQLKNSKEELIKFLKDALKTINLKRLEGNLIIGLSNHTNTIKISSWIWAIGAILNSEKQTSLTVEPKFTEEIIDFEGKMELKINLLLLLTYSLFLLTERNIRELIKELYKENKEEEKEEEKEEKLEGNKIGSIENAVAENN